jgi:hypothetical protein
MRGIRHVVARFFLDFVACAGSPEGDFGAHDIRSTCAPSNGDAQDVATLISDGGQDHQAGLLHGS